MEQPNEATLKYLNSFPPGYRFCPTDEELVIDYLMNKVLNKPLPPNKILDINLYDHGPQDLSTKYRTSMCIEQGEKIMYFFTPRARKYPKGTRPDRVAGFGYWKATGVDNIIGEKTNPVGYRKSLVYYQGLHKRSIKTNWIMHEYRIDKNSPSRSANAAPNDMKLDDWVLCKVYLKETKIDKKNQTDTVITDTVASIIYPTTFVTSPMQINYQNNIGSTSFAPPATPLQRNNNVHNNFGSTSSPVAATAAAAAAAPVEDTNYSKIMFPDPQLLCIDYSTSYFLDEDVNDPLLMIDYNPPPTLDDGF